MRTSLRIRKGETNVLLSFSFQALLSFLYQHKDIQAWRHSTWKLFQYSTSTSTFKAIRGDFMFWSSSRRDLFSSLSIRDLLPVQSSFRRDLFQKYHSEGTCFRSIIQKNHSEGTCFTNTIQRGTWLVEVSRHHSSSLNHHWNLTSYKEARKQVSIFSFLML